MTESNATLSRKLVDTNVLLYAHDPRDPAKQACAVALIRRLIEAEVLTVTAQVVNELYVALTRPGRQPGLIPQQASTIVRDLMAVADVLPLTAATTDLALRAAADYGMHFWDALIWATAKENGVSVILTEDIPSAPHLEGIDYINPFAVPSLPW